MKILIVNRFFGGAQVPTGRMAEDVARVLAAGGHEVVALASSGAYEGAAQARDDKTSGLLDDRTKGQHDEKRQGTQRVETVRIPRWMPRALAWLWFTWQARRRIPRMDWDVCVLMTDPPLLPLLARRAARPRDKETKRRKDEGAKAADGPRDHRTTGPRTAKRRVAVWLMDLYPEALAASGWMTATNPIYRWYLKKRKRALEKCDLVVCLGEEQTKRLETKRPKDQESQTAVAVVPPWDDRGNIAQATEDSLRNLALYAGNLGEAHCFEEILAAVPFLPADWRIRFAVRGAKLAALKAAASELKRPKDEKTKRRGATLEVTGYASEEETPQLLASARVHLITMSPGWEGIVVPSKLYGCIRTGRPVLFIGPENADTAREIRRNDWGIVLPFGTSEEEVAAAILTLAARPTRASAEQNGAEEVAKRLSEVAGI